MGPEILEDSKVTSNNENDIPKRKNSPRRRKPISDKKYNKFHDRIFDYSRYKVTSKEDVSFINERSVEVATFHRNVLKIISKDSVDHQAGCPYLKETASKIANKSELDSKLFKMEYIGSNLYENYKKYKAMEKEPLHNPISCFLYIQEWEKMNSGKKYADDKELLIISPRHHLNDLIMAPFEKPSDPEVSVLLTYLGGNRILLSQDFIHEKTEWIDKNRANTQMRKIINSGFALEDLLIEDYKSSILNSQSNTYEGVKNINNFFSVVENDPNDSVRILLRSEMDAYNRTTGSYSELKCFAQIKMGNRFHRKKLLKTWVQISQLPSSDVLFGLRDTESGLLYDLKWMSRKDLAEKCNSYKLSMNQNIDYSPTLAYSWYQHVIRSINDLVNKFLKANNGNINEFHSFRLIVEKNKNIRLKHLQKVPKCVPIPDFYLEKDIS